MWMRYVLASLLIGSLLGGCSAVLSTEPVGSEPLALLAEEWDGTWSDSQDFLELRVIDSESGRLGVAWVEYRGDDFDLERLDVWLRKSGDVIFANVLEVADDDEGTDGSVDDTTSGADPYALFRVSREGEKLIVWSPKLDAFKALVEEGKLPGTVTEGGDVVLGSLSDAQLTLLASDESAHLWSWQEPGILLRTSD
jgi:hypothetical protein